MTNKEKFKEVFGFMPTGDNCLFFLSSYCKKIKSDCTKCKMNSWWNEEYKETERAYGHDDYPCIKCKSPIKQSCFGCPEEKAWRANHRHVQSWLKTLGGHA